jgi:hypothetical protein
MEEPVRLGERGALLIVVAAASAGATDAQTPATAAVPATPVIIDLEPVEGATIRGNVVLHSENGETSVVVTLYDTRPLAARGDSVRLRYAASLQQGTCAVPGSKIDLIAAGIGADGNAAGGELEATLAELVATRPVIQIVEEKRGRAVACAVVRRG